MTKRRMSNFGNIVMKNAAHAKQNTSQCSEDQDKQAHAEIHTIFL